MKSKVRGLIYLAWSIGRPAYLAAFLERSEGVVVILSMFFFSELESLDIGLECRGHFAEGDTDGNGNRNPNW